VLGAAAVVSAKAMKLVVMATNLTGEFFIRESI